MIDHRAKELADALREMRAFLYGPVIKLRFARHGARYEDGY